MMSTISIEKRVKKIVTDMWKNATTNKPLPSITVNVEFWQDGNPFSNISVFIHEKTTKLTLAYFYLGHYPSRIGNEHAGILMAYDSFIYEDSKKQEFETLLMEIKIAIAKALNYSAIQYVAQMSNTSIVSWLYKFDWKCIYVIRKSNGKTVGIFIKDIVQ